MTAENDWATGCAFPVGQYPLSIPKSFAKPYAEGPDERTLFSHTAGHTPWLYSHELKPVPAGTEGPNVFAGENTSYSLERLAGGWNKSPYWVLSAPPDVINGHGGIFSPAFGDFLATILDESLVSKPEAAVGTEV